MYAIRSYYAEVLGLEYQLIADNVKSYRIVEANSRLIIADSFFSDLKEDYPYYKDADLIPESVVFADYPALGCAVSGWLPVVLAVVRDPIGIAGNVGQTPAPVPRQPVSERADDTRITSYNVCYTKLLRE